MVEAECKSAVDCERAAEAHATEHCKFTAPFQQQTDELEEVFVPAHGDAVLGNPAEAGHHASIERLAPFGRVAGGAEPGAGAAPPDPRKFRFARPPTQPVHPASRVTLAP